MSERVWSEAEIAALRAAEPDLEKLGMYTTGAKGDQNAAQFLKFFELQPDVVVSVETLLSVFEGLKQRNMLHVKGEGELQFEKVTLSMSDHDRDVLEAFMRRNRLWADGDGKFSNACLLMSSLGGRPCTYDNLAHFALPYVGNIRGKTLVWVTPSHQQNKTYGSHSGVSAHFAPKSETNVGSSFVGRIDHAKQPSTAIPRPSPASAKLDSYQWDRLANSLVADSGRHSDTAAIQRAVKDAGSGEAGYRAGVAMQKHLRMERERGR